MFAETETILPETFGATSDDSSATSVPVAGMTVGMSRETAFAVVTVTASESGFDDGFALLAGWEFDFPQPEMNKAEIRTGTTIPADRPINEKLILLRQTKNNDRGRVDHPRSFESPGALNVPAPFARATGKSRSVSDLVER
jgi:hypothetical protein